MVVSSFGIFQLFFRRIESACGAGPNQGMLKRADQNTSQRTFLCDSVAFGCIKGQKEEYVLCFIVFNIKTFFKKFPNLKKHGNDLQAYWLPPFSLSSLCHTLPPPRKTSRGKCEKHQKVSFMPVQPFSRLPAPSSLHVFLAKV